MRASKAMRLPGLLLALTLVACDTEVTNPGPIQGEFLSDPAAQPAMVEGIGRAVSDALNWLSYTGAAVAREIHPGGSTGSFGITAKQQEGLLAYDDGLTDHWIRAHRARGMAEEFMAIIAEDPVDSETLAQGYLWGGYAYRLLGDHMCDYVVDGGSPGDRLQYYTDALRFFDLAANSGSGDIRLAAIAGRAAAKVSLGDWAGAVSDAGQIPTAFSYEMPYYNLGDDDQANRIHFSTKSIPYRAHTQWNTWHELEGFNAEDNPDGDPRIPWRSSDIFGDAALDCCGQVPWFPEIKHDENDAPIEMSSGVEMRLIEAEDQLMKGNLGAAMGILNDLRARPGVNMPPLTAASIQDGWTALKHERGIELWLEGRRLPDLWRWENNGTPGELHELEEVGDASNLRTRCFCFPISEGEEQTNPNISGTQTAQCSS
jgi:hypothetical protein